MKAVTGGVFAVLVASGGVLSATRATAEHEVPSPPPRDIPQPIGIAKITAEVGVASVVVTTDLTLVRGPYAEGDLDAYVAFGAPGVPLAFDARLCPVAAGYLDAPADAPCAKVASVPWPRAPSHAAFVVGRPAMAGLLLPLGRAELARAFAPDQMATLRLRALYRMPQPASDGFREIVVRLGESRGSAYPVGQIDVDGAEGVTLSDADARLCGPNIDETHLTARGAAGAWTTGIAPVRAPRATTDDLCLRFRVESHEAGSAHGASSPGDRVTPVDSRK